MKQIPKLYRLGIEVVPSYQLSVLAEILDARKDQRPLTIRELCKRMGGSGWSFTAYALNALRAKGLVEGPPRSACARAATVRFIAANQLEPAGLLPEGNPAA